MNAQMLEDLFVESYMMVNFEITFNGVRQWFEMAGYDFDEATLFRCLLFPEQISSDRQAELARLVVYRYEDVFFQVSRMNDQDSVRVSIQDESEPVHQLLLRLMNVRSLRGVEDTIIDLGVALQKDKSSASPLYGPLHRFFEIK
ncbi:hypothetical protein [Cohnella soli]|uniref:Uncharacterized protein n=1 Tax=Cohnella soli TaxID=425005 RepID=A0ABW0HQT1_9BACL